MIIGCFYRHPTSLIPISQFSDEYLEPLLEKIAKEDKTYAIMGDFNIDLIKSETNDDIANYYNNFTNHSYNPLILQPTRLESKTLIDNIFLNSLEYNTFSGNLTIQLADHAFQFVIMEGFHKEMNVISKISVNKNSMMNFSTQTVIIFFQKIKKTLV